jgi:hypothetical protein
MTCEPGDLPARSPNRWTGGPYGARFRSGDVNADAKAVWSYPSKRSSVCERRFVVRRLCAVSFASGLVSPDALKPWAERKRRIVALWDFKEFVAAMNISEWPSPPSR